MFKIIELAQNQILTLLLVTSRASLDIQVKVFLKDWTWIIFLLIFIHTSWLLQSSKRLSMRTILYCYSFLETGRSLNQNILTFLPFLQT